MSGTIAQPEGITDPPIDELMSRTDSKYALVIYAARRARQINAYYSQLGEGLLEYVGPLVETSVQEKPLSIALREINNDLLTFEESDTPIEPGAGFYGGDLGRSGLGDGLGGDGLGGAAPADAAVADTQWVETDAAPVDPTAADAPEAGLPETGGA